MINGSALLKLQLFEYNTSNYRKRTKQIHVAWNEIFEDSNMAGLRSSTRNLVWFYLEQKCELIVSWKPSFSQDFTWWALCIARYTIFESNGSLPVLVAPWRPNQCAHSQRKLFPIQVVNAVTQLRLLAVVTKLQATFFENQNVPRLNINKPKNLAVGLKLANKNLFRMK